MTLRVVARTGFATDIGMRALNEDSALAGRSVFVVADGMGGHLAGEIASRTVVDVFSRLDGKEFVSAYELEGAIAQAARRVAGLASQKSLPGTTVTGLEATPARGSSTSAIRARTTSRAGPSPR